MKSSRYQFLLKEHLQGSTLRFFTAGSAARTGE
jgi:hypothetical protein